MSIELHPRDLHLGPQQDVVAHDARRQEPAARRRAGRGVESVSYLRTTSFPGSILITSFVELHDLYRVILLV